MSSGDALGNAQVFSGDFAKRTLKDSLYDVVHLRREMSLTEISLRSGVKYDTCAAYMAGETGPGLDKALSIYAVLPLRCFNVLLSHIGLSATRCGEQPPQQIADQIIQLANKLAGGEQ